MPTTPHPVSAASSTAPAAPDRDPDGVFDDRRTRIRPASFAQQRLWFLSQLRGGGTAYNETLAFTLTGPLDRRLLAAAFDVLTDRHETLRTRLVAEAGGVVQHIDPPGGGFPLAFEDLAGTPDGDARVAARQREEAGTAFDLEHGPLGRGRLLAVRPDRHVLLLTFHHSVYDGASLNVMMRELGPVYEALADGRAHPLPDLPAQYADHAHRQREAVLGGALAAQEEYWVRTLADAPTLLELPTDRPRPAEQSFDGGRVEFRLDADVTAALRVLARSCGATPFVVVLTGWALLLARLSGQEDIVVGTPVANRRGPEASGLIGFLVNSLPIRVDLSGSPTVAEAVTRVRAVVRDALAHQDLPFERVVERVNPPRSAAYTPLFQTMLAWVPDRRDLLDIAGVETRPLPIAHAPAKFDLAVAATESEGRVTGELDYATALLDHATAERWTDHLVRLLTGMARHPERAVTELELMDEEESRRLILLGDATPTDAGTAAPEDGPHAVRAVSVEDGPQGVRAVSAADGEPAVDAVPPAAAPSAVGPSAPAVDPLAVALRSATGLVDLVEAQVRARPEGQAVVDADGGLDYAGLDRRANRLAHALVARSVRPGDVVGLHAGRTRDLLVGLLGILKAGAVYLPLDPGQPHDRLTGMVEDAACPLVLTDHAPADRPAAWLDLAAVEAEGATGDTPPQGIQRAPGQLAYVIFTSGSTGRPKGVAVEHRSVLNLFATWHDRMGTAPGEHGSAWSSIGFDASIHELLLPLTTGGVLHLVPDQLRGDPAAFLGWMREHAVTQAFLPPAYVKWIDEDPAERLRDLPLRRLLTGVESLTEAALHRMTEHLPGLRICFGYGPTEATLYSTAHHDVRPLERPCPIGRPLPGTRLYVLDALLRPVPPGVVGEVYLGGASLARGYLGRPDLTDERFLPDPYVPGARIYRTGDLARRDPDGVAHYAGRADDQVKLRGFRIEPAEIEAALTALPGVREAVVLLDRDAPGGPRLVAGVGRGTGPARSAGDWRAALAPRLPDYMIPGAFVDLDALPLNRSGKVDRRALLDLARAQATDQVNTASPRDHVEHALYRIWQRVLLHPEIGVRDNFFDIGGTSLSAIKMAHEVGEALGRTLPVAEVVARPTIEQLGAHLRADGPDTPPGSLIEFRPGTGPRVVCVHPAGGTAFCYLPLAAHLPEHAGLYGIQSPGVNPGEALQPTVETMAAHYLRLLESLGPGSLVLTGLSYGGLVAHEMGRRLGRAGRRDVSVVLLDTQATDDAEARAAITPVDAQEFRDKLVRFNGMYPGIDDAQVERYFRIYNHNRLTARDHLPAPSPTRLTLAEAVADGTDSPFHAEVRTFWERRAEGEFRVETLKCDHWEILEGEHAAHVGALLTAELAHVEARSADPAAPPAPPQSLGSVAGTRRTGETR
ncbi:amino acid adenylation domain-containing protein [Streptomyces sp. NPDC058417]|uniref:non-ribosomal peptide synthetase n=1 Tax=unclassified Streptomyces TaxID=2593676 RepID=UPI00364A4D6A